jgi:septum formation protein
MGSPEPAGRAASEPRARLVLASTSPQRRAILSQLGIAFEAVTPAYREEEGGDPLNHAAGKARSVDGGGLPVLGVDTVVVCGGRRIGKPADAAEAATILESLSGRHHEVVSGVCLRACGWEELRSETTRVAFRALPRAEIERYLSGGEWEGRAGAYAIQGLGAGFVERIEGDYLNVVGLPGAVLVGLLASRFPGAFGFGEPGRAGG